MKESKIELYDLNERKQVGYRLERRTTEKIDLLSKFYECTPAELLEQLFESNIKGEIFFEKTGSLEEIKNIIKKYEQKEINVDTVIVPSKNDTFQQMFLAGYWSCIGISPSMATNKKLKYLSCYESSPISRLRFYAEIDDIKPNPIEKCKYDIILKNTIYKFDNTITVFKSGAGVRHFMYANLENLINLHRKNNID